MLTGIDYNIPIPSSVTSIGNWAFSNCSSLTSVLFESSSGWKVSKNSDMSSLTSLSSSKLSNLETAATYLTLTFCRRYWKKN